jgi:glycosyltransferase involved in cell wall biosynthesis
MIDATGGTERVALEIAKIQASRGYDVTIASMTDESWQGTWEQVRLLHLTPYSLAGRRFGRHFRLASLVRSGHFDLIHFHEYVRTSFIMRQPNVMQFHNNPLDTQDFVEFTRIAPRFWAEISKSSAQIAVSDFVKQRLTLIHQEAGSNAPPEHIVTNYSGVDSKVFHSETMKGDRSRLRQKLGLKDTDVLFLFAGAVRPEKGVDYLARAFARLSDENPNACLAIAGGGRLWIEQGWLRGRAVDATEEQVRTILSPAIALKRAFMLGIVSPAEIRAYYAAADVFVLPSMFQETFGLVVLEAFSARVPVIAFKSGGVPELVEDRKNGIIVGQGDEEALFASMRELILDQELRRRLGEGAVRTAARFPWENTVNRLEVIYLNALQRHRTSA